MCNPARPNSEKDCGFSLAVDVGISPNHVNPCVIALCVP